jgi:hypothetical protein
LLKSSFTSGNNSVIFTSLVAAGLERSCSKFLSIPLSEKFFKLSPKVGLTFAKSSLNKDKDL